MKFSTYFFALPLILVSCSGTGTSSERETAVQKAPSADTMPTSPRTEQPAEASAKSETALLSGKFLGETDYGVPKTLVLLTINGKTQTIDTVSACETISKAEFATYDIPANALTACGGWFAGSGDYFYATIRKGKVIVFEGWQDEQQEDSGFHWKVKKIR